MEKEQAMTSVSPVPLHEMNNQPKKQTIGVALIARNAGKTIRKCLESVAPYVDQIVVVYAGQSTDNTEAEVKEVLYNYPIVETYPFEWIDDFSAARNYSFSKLNTDWYCWIDADDYVEGADKLPALVAKAAPNVGAIWFRYDYSKDEFGNVTNIYIRERLLRASFGWVWRSRVHETLTSLSNCAYVRSNDVVVKHEGYHEGGSRGDRNFKLLYLMLKEEPENKRVWLYLGHQFFAGGNWLKATEWYLKFAQDAQAVPVERYQAYNYASKAMLEFKDIQQAVNIAMSAIELMPNMRDAYHDLARAYLFAGVPEKTIHWLRIAENKEMIQELPEMVFVNPLEYTYFKNILMSEAYYQLRDLDNSIRYLIEANKQRPMFQDKIDSLIAIKNRNEAALSVKRLAVDLLENKELLKLKHLKEACPFWFKETPEYQELSGGIDFHTKDIKDGTVVKDNLIDISASLDPAAELEKMDKLVSEGKLQTVSVKCSSPGVVRTLSRLDMEELLQKKEGRRVINLREEADQITMEYDLKKPDFLLRMFLGQGLEHWNPDTIKEIGCGGSETSAAYVCKEFAKEGKAYSFLYAMDNQVYDGVIYRSVFNPSNPPCNLFIASRTPGIFLNDTPAFQRWLWIHDTDCGPGLTPDIAQQLDAIVVLSKWHLGHIQRVYPFLKNCKVMDFDNLPLTYEDPYTRATFYPDAKCTRLPVLAVIGDGIDTSRFNYPMEKTPNSFIWSSAPDRGLVELLAMWGQIREALPDATLDIYYGWEYFDKSLYIPEQRLIKQQVLQLVKQPGVRWVGRVGQTRLAEIMAHTQCILYPPHPFRETCYITGLEAQASRVLTFYRQNGALGETVGNRGISIPMDAKPEDIVNVVTSTLKNKELCDKILAKGREYAMKERDWSNQADKMKKLYDLIEEVKIKEFKFE